ncbi:MAG: hypothetical protein PHE21_00590 [Candidatus Dojkabacteria bacterium]|nr:hypothetical protein [Candidatus Dojkabacteria bacterium]
MTKKPFINALIAILYIIFIVLLITGISSISTLQSNTSEFVAPIIMISLFTLSAAVMGYVFCYQPLRLYLDGKKEQAVKLFIKTVIIFACITFGLIATYLLVINI